MQSPILLRNKVTKKMVSLNKQLPPFLKIKQRPLNKLTFPHINDRCFQHHKPKLIIKFNPFYQLLYITALLVYSSIQLICKLSIKLPYAHVVYYLHYKCTTIIMLHKSGNSLLLKKSILKNRKYCIEMLLIKKYAKPAIS